MENAGPSVYVTVPLEGRARFDLPADLTVGLHTEQGGYTSDPRPPSFTGETLSFVRPGAAVLRPV